MKTSTDRALEWETANYARAMQLNDMLDALPSYTERRLLFQTFTKEEQNGLMPEYERRFLNRDAPIGSLVKPAYPKRGISITIGRGSQTVTTVSHFGLATGLSYQHGDYMRLLLLHPPWRNKEGDCVWVGEASIGDLVVV